jgi:glycosyltransferase involved in cell wall biosynthesis
MSHHEYRRHVVIVCPHSGGGGSVAAVALRQAAGLSRFFRIILVSDSHPTQLIDGVKYLCIKPPTFQWLRRYSHVPREFAFSWQVRRELFNFASAQRLDFVLCHSHSSAALAARPLQSYRGIPYGLITHGDIFDRPDGTYDSRLTAFYKAVTPRAYRRANLVIALSPHMRQLALRGGASDQSVVVIPNGIDPSDIGLTRSFIPPPRLAPGTPLRLLFVGRFAVEKGIDTLLRACRLLVRRHVEINLRLVGDGPLRSNLQTMTAELGLNDCVQFSGSIPKHLLGREYLASHAVCVPSRSDPFPTVVLEAMAAGRPVIGTNVGGIPSAIEHEKSGLLVSAEAPEELADVLAGVSCNPDVLIKMGRYGHQECRTRFNWTTVTQQLGDSIDSAIQKKSFCDR